MGYRCAVARSRSAAGSAAGYHFQIQRALLDLLDADDDEIGLSIETLDDLTLSDDQRAEVRGLEQLKHSVNPGSLTDASRQWWEALAVWMDLAREGKLTGEEQLRLICTQVAPPDSAAALLRNDDVRDVAAAAARLLAAARSSDSAETKASRECFAGIAEYGLDDGARTRLLERIFVVDGAEPVGEFRYALRARLRAALPASGQDAFLDQVVGMWERHAVDLLLRRRASVTKSEVLAEVARIRDGYTEQTLPEADPPSELDQLIASAYEASVFVHQLRLVAMRHERVRLAIIDYHRAFAQRAKWLNDGVLGPGQLTAWERRLVDEWEQAFERMLDAISEASHANELQRAGLELYNQLQDSDRVPLRGSTDFFLNRGTQHGLADIRRIGWHRDYQRLLEQRFGPATDRRSVTDAYDAAVSTEAGRP
jgi:hypothetical protein